ncbi:Gfo/Idh/MocA family oxidoreductase [Terrilactibacillus sp. S3-3]|nr:Gfo/Idh/MocA family oxidoreductase [Terrilactibacillus sp. S3-3]
MAKTIHVGIIGGSVNNGWASLTHIPSLQQNPSYNISAVSTSNPESAKKSAEALHAAQAFTDNQELAASDAVDLVTVSVKVPFHYKAVLAAIKNRKNIYCEWPLTQTTDQAKELAVLAEKAQIHHAIGLQARQSPEVNRLREALKNGEIGKVLSCSMRVAERPKGSITNQREAYLIDKKNGATLFTISGGHSLDTLCYVMDSWFHDVSASLKSNYDEATVIETGKKIPKDSAYQIFIQGTLVNGVSVTVHIQGGSQPEFICEIRGEKGTFRLVQDRPLGHVQFGNLILEKIVHEDYTQSFSYESMIKFKTLLSRGGRQNPSGKYCQSIQKISRRYQ